MRPSPDLAACRLYAILDAAYLGNRDPATVAVEMIRGGVDIIQVRAKDRTPAEIAAMTRAVLHVARPTAIPVVVNDHPRVAVETDADGVHVGQDDADVAETRAALGGEKWVGKSTHSLDQALAAEQEGADYIGVGPIFATPTKPTYAPVGLELVRDVSSRLKIPFFCIGGIKLENAEKVLAAGARRLVVVSGILQAPAIADYCQQLRKMLH